MEGPARVAGEPGQDLGMLVGGIVVEDGVDHLARRHLALDRVQEADELLVLSSIFFAAFLAIGFFWRFLVLMAVCCQL
jgi:hypothetical protein